ncbi:MAG TPA: arabinan endo-1,5-alpha-L-arabinosidase, partial [Paludibacteraceae bacterium]|nr:arabinan endo-1,5-alpha-L-arabinosidase [Paludibacteraceae bacterium]
MRLRYILILSISITALSFVGCKPDEPKPDDKPNPFPTFTIPTYADDYSSISSWANRNKWNLANVHDPSVAYYKGYYYMYGT